MDRREFLTVSGRLGLAVGIAGVVDACFPSPTPSRTAASPTLAASPIPASPAIATQPPVTPSPPAHRDPSMAIENRRPGDRGWDVTTTGPRLATDVEGFASASSVAPGDTLDLHLGVPAADTTVRLDWYRLGWYGGLGGRLVRTDPVVVVERAAPSSIDEVTGLAEAPWPVTLSVTIPPDWPSGAYRVVIKPRVGPAVGAVPFVVRPAPGARRASILFVTASATWQAYNPWGGADLYTSSPGNQPTASSGSRAVVVSYDRPYAQFRGLGYQGRWELPFIRWQEREGRDVDYCADVDLELHPELVTERRLLVFAGHHEYWSRPMRTAVEGAIGAGTNVAFLSGNELTWQVRLGPSPQGDARRITCYKSAPLDPLTPTQPDLSTCRWREPPVDDPEATVIGEMYGHIVVRPADWVVSSHDHWLYEGTGLDEGDRLRNLVGQEYDTFYPDLAHPGTTILARSPVQAVIHGEEPGVAERYVPLDDTMHNATIYTADSGATVMAAGTFQWSWALDDYGPRAYKGIATPVDLRVGTMTRNLFDRLGDGPV